MTDSKKTSKKGHIHSFESFGTVDGPGIRFVVFMAGCHLRCAYCHNIDMTNYNHSKLYSPEEVLAMIVKNKPYFEKSGGGVTLSGGDPLFQPAFVRDLLKLCQKEGIHTTVDTSLYGSQDIVKSIMPHADLFMVSLKHFDDKSHTELTGVSNKSILENIRFLSDQNQRLWLRYVVLPGVTDTPEHLQKLKNFLKDLNYEKLELLPYHTMGIPKWEALKIPYKFKGLKPPTENSLKSIHTDLLAHGIPATLSD